MRKHFLKFFCALVLAFTLAICATACDSKDDNNSQANKSSFATTYSTLSEKNNATSKWREGMVSGNGLQGFITSGSPYNDTLIYQNRSEERRVGKEC